MVLLVCIININPQHNQMYPDLQKPNIITNFLITYFTLVYFMYGRVHKKLCALSRLVHERSRKLYHCELLVTS